MKGKIITKRIAFVALVLAIVVQVAFTYFSGGFYTVPLLILLFSPYLTLLLLSFFWRKYAPAFLASLLMMVLVHSVMTILFLFDDTSYSSVGASLAVAFKIILMLLLGAITLFAGLIAIKVKEVRARRRGPLKGDASLILNKDILVWSALIIMFLFLAPEGMNRIVRTTVRPMPEEPSAFPVRFPTEGVTGEKLLFLQAINSSPTLKERTELCQAWFEKTEDFDLKRDIQDIWVKTNYLDAHSFFQELFNIDPESPRGLYFLGRIQPDPVRRITFGMAVVIRDRTWPYGYRLIVHTYLRNLFDQKGNPIVRETLKQVMVDYKEIFTKFDEIETDREFADKVMYRYYRYQGETAKAAERLDKGKLYGWSWALAADTLDAWELRLSGAESNYSMPSFNYPKDSLRARWVK